MAADPKNSAGNLPCARETCFFHKRRNSISGIISQMLSPVPVPMKKTFQMSSGRCRPSFEIQQM